MNSRMDVESLLNKLSQYVPVRHRLVLTRQKTVRARFVVLPALGVSMLALLATAMLSPSSGMDMDVAAAQPVILGSAPVDVADVSPEQSLLQRLHLSQKRMQRSMNDAEAAAEDMAAIAPAAGNEAIAMADPSKPVTPQEKIVGAKNPQEKTVKIGTGDTLSGVLNRAGLSNDEAYQVVEAVRKHVDPKALRPGQTLNIKFDRPGNNTASNDGRNPAFQFASLNMAVDPLRTVSVARNGDEDEYRVDMHEKSMEKHLYAQEATIENSLFGSAAKAGIPVAVITDAIRIYSQNVDFQRDVREGDKIQVMYEQYETAEGVKIKTGNLVYAKLILGDNEMPIYRYEQKDGGVDYLQPNGRTIRKTLMKTPVDGARISSGFGFRIHPILGYNKMHKGIDFAAATGTPIYAAGDGTVEKAGRVNGYGNYVKLRHNSQLSTAYGHMSRIAVAPGTHVRQGQVIGYVGMTGAATGPHLHYEILVNNVQVNPRGVNLPTGQTLEGNQLKLFKAYAAGIDRSFNTAAGTRVAANATKSFTGEASIR